MNSKFLTGLVLATLALSACKDSTDNIGMSLEDTHGVSVSTNSFDVPSQSIYADSVLANNAYGYLGKVKDPETGMYITADYMTQFNSIEASPFPELSNLITYDSNGTPILGSEGTIKADSCEIRLFFDSYYGDSLQSLKLTAYEMSKPMNETQPYYSNFDPLARGYVRTDGIRQDKEYNLVDYNVAKSITSTYTPYITIKLNKTYKDKEGKTYDNFGTYILQKYYSDKNNFKNALTFRNHVVPGFFFKIRSGVGNMAHIQTAQLAVHFKYQDKVAHTESANGKTVTTYRDTTYNGVRAFWSTEEVLQTTTFSNDKASLSKLVSDNSCTYLKTPAGIFTELTLPIEEIMKGHENDTLSSASVSLQRINNSVNSKYSFAVPKTLLMVPKDSLKSFFEKSLLDDSKTSYIAAWGYTAQSTRNNYTFNNIASLITKLYRLKENGQASANWNKVLIVPVEQTITTTTNPYTGQPITTKTKISNDMSLSSTRLVKGTSTDSPVKINVIYSKFK
jgi:hypothetical protein